MMAYQSVSYAIQQECLRLLKAVDPPFDSIPTDNMLIRKLPIAQEQLTKLPAILIAPYGEQEQEPMDFEGTVNNFYRIEICLVTPNGSDMASNQDLRQGWQEKARRTILRNLDNTLRTKLQNAPTVWDMNEEQTPTFDRAKLNQLYDYLSLVIRFHSQERTN